MSTEQWWNDGQQKTEEVGENPAQIPHRRPQNLLDSLNMFTTFVWVVLACW